MSSSTSRQPIRWNDRGRAVGFALTVMAGVLAFFTIVPLFILVFGAQP